VSDGVNLWVCANCATAHFPAKLICCVCGSNEGETRSAAEGMIEELTSVHRAVGGASEAPRRLATVQITDGPRVIAGLDEQLAVGERVTLREADGAVHAKRLAR
jgi:uncharacterized OB-fold protein